MAVSTCARCGSAVPDTAKFCVMCGMKVAPETPGTAYGTSTLTGSGFIVALATAVMAAAILAGLAVLIQAFE